MKKGLFVILLFVSFISIPMDARATSGACSWHSGVNCGLGMQSDGGVYCNDGWTESTTYYQFTAACEGTGNNTCRGYSPDCKYLQDDDLLNTKKSIASQNLEAFIEESEKYGYALKDDFSQAYVKSLYIDQGALMGNYMDYLCNCTRIDAIIDKWQYKGGSAIPDDVINEAIRIMDCQWEGKVWDKTTDTCVAKRIVPKSTSASTSIPEGAIIKTANNPDVYIVKYKNGKRYKRLILSPSVFKSYGHLRWEDLITVSQQTMDSFVTSSYVRVAGDPTLYMLFPRGDQGEKRLVSNFQSSGMDTDSIYEINSVDRDSYVTGAVYR